MLSVESDRGVLKSLGWDRISITHKNDNVAVRFGWIEFLCLHTQKSRWLGHDARWGGHNFWLVG